jgi:hypothetical protein
MEPAEATLTCLICGRSLHSEMPEELVRERGWLPQPYAGTWFTSHGQYGSTVFDEMDTTYLLITVCDQCVLEKAAAGLILLRTPDRPTPRLEPQTEIWDPGMVWCEACGRAALGAFCQGHAHDKDEMLTAWIAEGTGQA